MNARVRFLGKESPQDLKHNGKSTRKVDMEHEIILRRAIPSECHAEVHTDYSGEAVRWGLTHHVNSAADCCQACLDQAKNATEEQKKCNIWVYSASEGGCYSPDKYFHKNHECWLEQVYIILNEDTTTKNTDNNMQQHRPLSLGFRELNDDPSDLFMATWPSILISEKVGEATQKLFDCLVPRRTWSSLLRKCTTARGSLKCQVLTQGFS